VPFREDGNLVMGATTKGRWSYACSKAIDEFLVGLLAREETADDRRASLQYGRAAADRPVRHGHSDVCETGAGRPADHRLWRRQTEPLFWLRRRRRRRAVKLMDHNDAVGQVFNIGSNVEISILELAERVKQITQSDSEIVFVPYDEAYEEGFEDMPRRVPDISKISELVGFRPEMSLDGILERVIDYQIGRRRVPAKLATDFTDCPHFSLASF
jgi:UDP-glucose 4-epimerase